MSEMFTAALKTHMQIHAGAWNTWGVQSIRHHIKNSKCTGWEIPASSKANPDTKYEFAGTDYEMDAVQVIKLDRRVNCSCKKFTDQEIVLVGTFSELLTQLLSIEVPSSVTF